MKGNSDFKMRHKVIIQFLLEKIITPRKYIIISILNVKLCAMHVIDCNKSQRSSGNNSRYQQTRLNLYRRIKIKFKVSGEHGQVKQLIWV